NTHIVQERPVQTFHFVIDQGDTVTAQERPHQEFNWVESCKGQIPEGAWYVGGYAIGRGQYNNGKQVGYVVPGKGLVIGYNTKEITLSHYEVLKGDPTQYRWIRCQGPCKPQHFVPLYGGHEGDGRELYIAKGWYNNREFIGKAAPHLGGMNFGYMGHDHYLHDYQVLALLD
ncbi:6444_t:CDS:2, partial [Acaulospora morrowiae]